MTLAILLPAFWTMQVLANVAFKYGSLDSNRASRRWLAGFAAGNAVGASSMYLMMLIFARMPANPNLATVLGGVGGSLGSQITLAVLFRSRLSPTQWAGILLAVAGTALATLAAHP